MSETLSDLLKQMKRVYNVGELPPLKELIEFNNDVKELIANSDGQNIILQFETTAIEVKSSQSNEAKVTEDGMEDSIKNHEHGQFVSTNDNGHFVVETPNSSMNGMDHSFMDINSFQYHHAPVESYGYPMEPYHASMELYGAMQSYPQAELAFEQLDPNLFGTYQQSSSALFGNVQQEQTPGQEFGQYGLMDGNEYYNFEAHHTSMNAMDNSFLDALSSQHHDPVVLNEEMQWFTQTEFESPSVHYRALKTVEQVSATLSGNVQKQQSSLSQHHAPMISKRGKQSFAKTKLKLEPVDNHGSKKAQKPSAALSAKVKQKQSPAKSLFLIDSILSTSSSPEKSTIPENELSSMADGEFPSEEHLTTQSAAITAMDDGMPILTPERQPELDPMMPQLFPVLADDMLTPKTPTTPEQTVPVEVTQKKDIEDSSEKLIAEATDLNSIVTDTPTEVSIVEESVPGNPAAVSPESPIVVEDNETSKPTSVVEHHENAHPEKKKSSEADLVAAIPETNISFDQEKRSANSEKNEPTETFSTEDHTRKSNEESSDQGEPSKSTATRQHVDSENTTSSSINRPTVRFQQQDTESSQYDSSNKTDLTDGVPQNGTENPEEEPPFTIDEMFYALTHEDPKKKYPLDKQGLELLFMDARRELQEMERLKKVSEETAPIPVVEKIDGELSGVTEGIVPAKSPEFAEETEVDAENDIVEKTDSTDSEKEPNVDLIKPSEPVVNVAIISAKPTESRETSEPASLPDIVDASSMNRGDELCEPKKQNVEIVEELKEPKNTAVPKQASIKSHRKKTYEQGPPKKKGRPKGSKNNVLNELQCKKAMKEIDEVHERARRIRELEQGLCDGEGPSTSEHRALKRQATDDADEPKSGQRKSRRLREADRRMNPFFCMAAMTYHSELMKLSESSRDPFLNFRQVIIPEIKNDSRKSAIKKTEIELPVEETLENGTSRPRRPRYVIRTDYKKKIAKDTIHSLFDKVLAPTPPGNMKILDHFEAPVVRRAIVNRNTLCYAISVVQVLLRIPQIYSIIRSHVHKGTDQNCLLCMLGGIISTRPSNHDNPEFVAVLKSSWKEIKSNTQQCVMEALEHFLNRIDAEYIHGRSAGLSTNPRSVRDFFSVYSTNYRECTWCAYKRKTHDKEIYVTVDLTRKSNVSMQALINDRLQRHIENDVKCPCCRNVMANIVVYKKLPDVLLYFIPRVRFGVNQKDMEVVTVQNFIHMADKYGEYKYELCSFIAHVGEFGNKGHYKSFEVDHHKNGSYNEFDDGKVWINAKLSSDITVVLAMFRKESSVEKDAPIDMIFDGRGNIAYADEKHFEQV